MNWQTKKITAISGAVRSYPVIQPDKAEPVSILAASRIDNAEPPSDIVTPKINNADPVNGIVTAQRKSGQTFQFKVPAAIAKTLKVGDPVYAEPPSDIVSPKLNNAEPVNDFAIAQSIYGNSNGQMNSYGYPATSADETTVNTNEAEKWVITPIPTMKGVLGRLNINFPDVERNILIYQQADNKFLRSVSWNDKIYPIAPGEYRFTLTNVPVDNVPIQKGHETRLKAGFLNVVSEGDWHFYNDTKEKAYTSGNKPKKLPLPVGSYQLKLGGQFYLFTIKDKETVEY